MLLFFFVFVALLNCDEFMIHDPRAYIAWFRGFGFKECGCPATLILSTKGVFIDSLCSFQGIYNTMKRPLAST